VFKLAPTHGALRHTSTGTVWISARDSGGAHIPNKNRVLTKQPLGEGIFEGLIMTLPSRQSSFLTFVLVLRNPKFGMLESEDCPSVLAFLPRFDLFS